MGYSRTLDSNQYSNSTHDSPHTTIDNISHPNLNTTSSNTFDIHSHESNLYDGILEDDDDDDDDNLASDGAIIHKYTKRKHMLKKLKSKSKSKSKQFKSKQKAKNGDYSRTLDSNQYSNSTHDSPHTTIDNISHPNLNTTSSNTFDIHSHESNLYDGILEDDDDDDDDNLASDGAIIHKYTKRKHMLKKLKSKSKSKSKQFKSKQK